MTTDTDITARLRAELNRARAEAIEECARALELRLHDESDPGFALLDDSSRRQVRTENFVLRRCLDVIRVLSQPPQSGEESADVRAALALQEGEGERT